MIYIDGQPHQMSVEEGGWAGLATWPPMKTPIVNDWVEQDGEEADLTSPQLGTRQADLVLYGKAQAAELVLDALTAATGSAHIITDPWIGRTFAVRLINATASSSGIDKYARLTLTLAQDNPWAGLPTDTVPTSTRWPEDTRYQIDGTPLTAWGVVITRGTASELAPRANVKAALLRNINALSGAQYDHAAPVTMRARDVRLYCHTNEPQAATAWANQAALLRLLTSPGEHTLTADGKKWAFRYKQHDTTALHTDQGIHLWHDFTLTLTLMHRMADTTVVLATEAGLPIITEDGYYMIDLSTPQSQRI